MNDRLSNAAETPLEHRIGIRVKLHHTTDAVELQPRELERLRVQEAHLRAALARKSLALTPLGYIEGSCVQYAVNATTDSAAESKAVETPIFQQLDYLIEEARAARIRLVAMTESAAQPGDMDASEAAVPEAGKASATTGIADDAVESDVTSAANACGPTAATSALRNGDDEALVRDIQHGPNVITLDGRPMQWSRAVLPIDGRNAGPQKTIECTTGKREHHFIDKHGRRYRIPDSCDPNRLIKGTCVNVDDIRIEHVLATTITKQRDLVFGRGNHSD